MSRAVWHTGDALTVLQSLPDESVDLVITSPPFLALRSYLPADHPDKASEMGSEATPGLFVDGLMRVVEECRRVLAPHGSIALELGDTYAGSGGAGGDYNADGLREGQAKFSGSAAKRAANGAGDDYRPSRAGRNDDWPLPKSLSLIPQTVWFTMVYGRNPHTGRQTMPWRLRNIVRWCRPNPPVGALGDKYRPATSELAIFAKDAKRYFDLDAVRHQHKSDPAAYSGNGYTKGNPSGEGEDNAMPGNPAGAPPLDYWVIPTQPYKGSHYATFPRKLLDVPLRSMVPQRVCRVCSKPSERITEIDKDSVDSRMVSKDTEGRHASRVKDTVSPQGRVQAPLERAGLRTHTSASVTIGWSDCGHDDWRNGIVLDCFAGSGTTLEVATGMGLDAIGIDLDERNYELALQRVGMFLERAE